MARRNKRTRDADDISRRSLRFDNQLLLTRRFTVTPIREVWSNAEIRRIDDKRQFRPGGVSSRRGITRSSTALVSGSGVRRPQKAVRSFQGYQSPPHQIGFSRPQEVSLCVRRRTRREVMHATGRAGRRGQKRAKWKPDSRISCRRR